MFFMRLEVIVHLVDIGGIVDHHCLKFLLIIHKGVICGPVDDNLTSK
jgi:hypothetical protein